MKYLSGIILIIFNACGSEGVFDSAENGIPEPLMSKSASTMRSDVAPSGN